MVCERGEGHPTPCRRGEVTGSAFFAQCHGYMFTQFPDFSFSCAPLQVIFAGFLWGVVTRVTPVCFDQRPFCLRSRRCFFLSGWTSERRPRPGISRGAGSTGHTQNDLLVDTCLCCPVGCFRFPFLGWGFPVKLNQPQRRAGFVAHGHWASELLVSALGIIRSP